MDLRNRKVAQFRATVAPLYGPKPMNSFDIDNLNAESEMTPVGVYVKLPLSVPGNKPAFVEFVVPYANVSAIKLKPADPAPEDKKSKK